MRLDLVIDQLEIQGGLNHDREGLARGIEEALDRLLRLHGLPYGQEDGEIEIEEAALSVVPGASLEEVASSIAHQLVAGLYRQASGQVPVDLQTSVESTS